MTSPIQRISQLQLELPPAPKPVGAYVPAVRSGNMVFTAGQLPLREGKLLAAGKVPADVDVKTAQACARQAVLNALAAACSVAGSPDDIVRVVRLNVFVNSSPGFHDQAAVANGASELLMDIFSEAGRHSRCAIGASRCCSRSWTHAGGRKW